MNPLFRDRVPEAAAQQIATVLAWLAECQLGTLADMEGRKSTSKRELARQRWICAVVVQHCHELGVQPRGFQPQGFGPRVVPNQMHCTHLAERLIEYAAQHPRPAESLAAQAQAERQDPANTKGRPAPEQAR